MPVPKSYSVIELPVEIRRVVEEGRLDGPPFIDEFTVTEMAEQIAALERVDEMSLEVWARRYLELAALVATWSKDTSTKVGCVVVGPDREIRSTGYNGLPRGCDDRVKERHERPLKYKWTEHAERNSIYNASRFGASLKGCAIYCTHPPCSDCARAIAQAGISVACFVNQGDLVERWAEDLAVAKEILRDSSVSVYEVSAAVWNEDAPDAFVPGWEQRRIDRIQEQAGKRQFFNVIALINELAGQALIGLRDVVAPQK
jgi:dCMP deaminase